MTERIEYVATTKNDETIPHRSRSMSRALRQIRKLNPGDPRFKILCLRALQILLGHTKLESTVRYWGVRSMTRVTYWRWSTCNLLQPIGPHRPQN